MYNQEKIKPYNSTDEKGKVVEEMFDNIASTYDTLNHRLSWNIDKSWRKKAIRRLAPFSPKTILDIATGTGDFAIMSAKMLLPKDKDEDSGEEVDPRAELVERLIEYKKCKLMARELADMEFDGERHLYKAPNIPKEVNNYKQPYNLDELFADIKIDKLKEIYEQILKKQDFRIDKQRSSFGTIKKEPISLEQKIHFVLEQVRLRRKLSFKSILINAKSRLDVVVSFLAILELMKLSRLKVIQESIGDEIMLISTEGTSEFEDIDLSKIEELV